MWNIDPIKMQEILYVYKYVQSMDAKVGLVEETKGGGKEGKKDSE
jgi:hypothetical protein